MNKHGESQIDSIKVKLVKGGMQGPFNIVLSSMVVVVVVKLFKDVKRGKWGAGSKSLIGRTIRVISTIAGLLRRDEMFC